MSNDSTLDTTGLFTRYGAEVRNFQGFGHERDDEGNWYWFFTADLHGKEDDGREYQMKARPVFMDQVVHDAGDEMGHRNMVALSKACMDYLHEHGEFIDMGRVWQAA